MALTATPLSIAATQSAGEAREYRAAWLACAEQATATAKVQIYGVIMPTKTVPATATPAATSTPTATATATETPGPTATPTDDGILWGVQLLSNEPSFESSIPELYRDRVIGIFPAAGVGAVDWAWFDARVAYAVDHGTPPWIEYWVNYPGQGNGGCSTATLTDQVAFASALAARVHNTSDMTYEVMNEPDLCTAAATYAQVFVQVANAILAADADATVTMGGLAFDQAHESWAKEFFKQVRAATGSQQWPSDYINLHRYDDQAPWGGGIPQRATLMRAFVTFADLDMKPLVVTETGDDIRDYWTGTGHPGAETEQQQAEGVARMLQGCRDAGAVVCNVYRGQDETSNDVPAWGLWRYDGSQRPAWQEFLNYAQ